MLFAVKCQTFIRIPTEDPVIKSMQSNGLTWCFSFNIGIKHGFSCINIHQVLREVLKTEARGHGFQHLPRDLLNIYALKNHVWSLLLHKNWKHSLHFALFLALFCFAFSLMSRKRNIHNYAHSRAGQYTSNGSKSVAPGWSYWKLHSGALIAHELPC